MKKILCLCIAASILFGIMFDYDLHYYVLPGTSDRRMICFHGYGANYQIANFLKKVAPIDATLVSFNFPDHDLHERGVDLLKATFGTIQELIPAFYVLKKEIIDDKHSKIDLYGFSAGGGAIINILAILNSSLYEKELKNLNIGLTEKQKILEVLQQGFIILDCPLKSIEEIIAYSGSSAEMQYFARNYKNNQLRPIDSIAKLKGLKLDILLHFQEEDEVIFNRDDALFIERLKQANAKGTTSVVIGNDGGHNMPHFSLWRFYSKTRVDISTHGGKTAP